MLKKRCNNSLALQIEKVRSGNHNLKGMLATEKEQAVLHAIEALSKKKGYSPSTPEVAVELGIKLSTLRARLWRLRGKGFVIWDDGISRSLRVCHEISTKQV